MENVKTKIKNIPMVILAAGQGSRLNNGNSCVPKPMAILNGQSLLERSLLTCRQAGVAKFFVVTGFMKERVGQHARELADKYALDLQILANDVWEEGNGTTAATCAPYIHGPFFIAMCDHLLHQDIFQKLVNSDDGKDCCYLAVDKNIDGIFDFEDATLVQCRNGMILEIDKNLKKYNAIDAGLFLCYPIIFDALEKSREEGDASLSGGIRRLTQAGKMKAVDLGDCFWLDVDTPESMEHGKKMLEKLG